jgi:sugar lactone lactonase YvrE
VKPWIASFLVVLAACGGRSKPPVPSPVVAAIDAALKERPDDPLLHYLRATAAPAEALPHLERMDALGWDVPLHAHEFTPVRDEARYVAIAASIAKRAPRIARSEVAFTLKETDLIPEGIAIDSRSGTLYVGSLRKRMVLAVDAAGAVTTFADSDDGLVAVLGMKVDEARDLLWVATWKSPSHEGAGAGDEGASAVVAFRIADGAVARSVRLPDDAGHLPNDLAISADGTVYVTDSIGGGVYRIPADKDVLETLVEPGTFSYPNGIALAADGALFVGHALGLSRVAVAAGANEPVAAPAGVILGGIDGLLRDGNRLFAVQNGIGQGRIVAFTLDDAGARITGMTVLENDPEALAIATTSALAGGALYTIANAQLDALGPDGLAADKTLTPSRVLRTPLTDASAPRPPP